MKISSILALFLGILFISSNILYASADYPIVFVSRNHQINGNILFPSAGLLPGMGPFSRFKVTGGRLLIRETSGNIVLLVDSTKNFNGITLIDVQQPCVHWNAQKIVFSGIEHPDSSWRIYEINVNGTGFKKLTHTDRIINLAQFGPAASRFLKYDDIDPIYTQDGKIVFASTRFPSLSMTGAVQTTNLYIMDSTGAWFRMTTERNGAEKPTIDQTTGRIIYSRWLLNIDMPSNQTASGLTREGSLAIQNADSGNIWQPIITKPDGDAITLYSGDPRSRAFTSLYRARTTPDGHILGVYSPDRSMLNTGSSTGIRFSAKGLSGKYTSVIGVNPSTPLYVQSPPSTFTMAPPYATDPVMMPDGKILFSYASTVEAQDYALYTINTNGQGLTPLFDLPGTLEFNAEVIAPRPLPPQLSYIIDYDTSMVPPTSDPSTYERGGLFRFDCLNIYANAPVDVPIDDAPDISKNPKLRFFLNFQRQDPQGKDNPILYNEINVDNTGFIAEGSIAANVSMFEQFTDSAGNIMVNSKGNIAHVAGLNFGVRGSGTKCVGCHVGHTQIEVPPTITEGLNTNLSTSAEVVNSSSLPGYEGKNVVDRKARTIDQAVNWIAQNNTNNEFVELSWGMYIDVRRLTLYNIFPNSSNNTDIKVTDCEIFMYNDSTLVKHIPSTGALDTGGTTLQVAPAVTMNRMKVIVKSFTGLINGVGRPGLAEIETNAKVSYSNNTGIEENNSNPFTYSLSQNYPNPFNPSTTITFSLPKAGYASLKVFDITGKEIATLIEGKIQGGINNITFNAERFASGIYFYRLVSGDYAASKKMVLLK